MTGPRGLLQLLVVAEDFGTREELRALIEATDEAVVLSDADGGIPDAVVVVLATADDPPLETWPGRPVVYTGPAEPLRQRLTEDRGPAGFVLAGARGSRLIAAARGAIAGFRVIDPALEENTGESLAGGALTPREREVLLLVARGLATKAIGRELGLSEHTAKFHVGQILQKLGAASRAEAVMLAARMGLIPL